MTPPKSRQSVEELVNRVMGQKIQTECNMMPPNIILLGAIGITHRLSIMTQICDNYGFYRLVRDTDFIAFEELTPFEAFILYNRMVPYDNPTKD